MVACAEDVRKRLGQQAQRQAARGGEVEENDSDEEVGARFVWDAAKGALVEAPAEEDEAARASAVDGAPQNDEASEAAEAPAAPAAAADVAAEAAASDDESGESESSEEEEEDDGQEAASREAFLNDASTPELIKQAVSLGGPMADGVRDKWVLDRNTGLSFRYDSAVQQIHCWNPGQGCMYHWVQRGRLDFLWASTAGPSETPPSGPNAAAAAAGAAGAEGRAPAAEAERLSLQVTVIPPEVLVAGGVGASSAVEDMEMSQKALAGVIGKGGASIKEIEKLSGVKAAAMEAKEGETVRTLRLEGTKAQIKEAKAMLEQKIIAVIGHEKAEKMQKHMSTRLLEKKRAETGSEAAKIGVAGLSEFCQKWSIKAVMARKLSRLDAQLQRYMIRHFNPKKAKPANALKGYIVALLKPPQRWRLEALHEDGELDGEVCETFAVGEGGAVVGRGGADEEHDGQQRIDLEVDGGAEDASKIYGDIQAQHCRLLCMGGDFYAWALEASIGTIVDGNKYRQHDGPVAIRDGSMLAVGKYMLFCEVGAAAALQARRARLLAGQGLWKSAARSAEAAADGGPASADSSAEAEGAAPPAKRPRTDGADEAAGGGAEATPRRKSAAELAAAYEAEATTGRKSAAELAAAYEVEAVSAAPRRMTAAELAAACEAEVAPAARAAPQRNCAAELATAYEAEAASAAPRLMTAVELAAACEAEEARAAPPRKSAAELAAAYEAEAAAAPRRKTAAELAAAYEAEAAGEAAPLSTAAALAAAYEAGVAAAEPERSAAELVAEAAADAPRRRSAAELVAAYAAPEGKRRRTAAPEAEEAEEAEEEQEAEEEDPMNDMLRQLGLPCGFK